MILDLHLPIDGDHLVKLVDALTTTFGDGVTISATDRTDVTRLIIPDGRRQPWEPMVLDEVAG